MENSTQINTGKLINATKTYCSQESARSAVARQESEILRLAEESQHVIISQMLNKLVKKGDFHSSEASNNNNNDHKESNEKPSLNSDDNQIKASSSSISNLDAVSDLNNKMDRLIFKIETSSKESLNQNEKENKKEEVDILKGTILNEEDETKKKESLNTPRKKKSHNTLGQSMKKFLTPDIPLHAIDRKSSQIFYAQSQAKTLCMNLDDEKEEEDEYIEDSSNKNEKLFSKSKNIDENNL